MVKSDNSRPANSNSGNNSRKVGAVMVCGGGIAGIQASLDLSAAGFRVYLVETAPSIGGAMAKLDKTFPTGDCATCILSPKLVECARDINIDLMTMTDVESVEGEAGNFKVRLRTRPRYVMENECNGCGDCIPACPVELKGLLDCRLGHHKAIDKPSAQSVPNVVTIEKQQRPPCQMACPLGQNAQGYIQLIRAGKYREAIDLIRETNPFPSICGYVCHHPCETACERGRYDDPVAIRALKRFAVEKAVEEGWKSERPAIEKREARIAVVGAGPGGMAAAEGLARRGFRVTVYEATDVLGGMMRLGIPGFRLPRRLIDAEIEAIRDMGVEFRTGMRLGDNISIDGLFGEGYKAIFIATGAYKGSRLDVEGADLEGVEIGLDFIQRANERLEPGGETREGAADERLEAGGERREDSGADNSVTGARPSSPGPHPSSLGARPSSPGPHPSSLGRRPSLTLGRRVAVIGGGNAAVDVARVARRLGAAQVSIIYRRTRHEMPADALEVADALAEGIRITFLTQPVRVVGDNGRVAGLECVRMRLAEKKDSSGRRRPEPVAGSEHVLPFDTVLVAIGQSPYTGFAKDGSIRVSKWSSIDVDPETMQTSRPGVFAGGDVVVGGGTLVEAIAAGKRAAQTIARYVAGEPLPEPKLEVGVGGPKQPEWSEQDRRRFEAKLADGGVEPCERVPHPEEGYGEQAARNEAARCLNCGICCECMECVRACQRNAVDHNQKEQERAIEVGAIILAPGYDAFDAKIKGEFGFGHYPNVLTGLQFERMLSASGPTLGHLKRPSDEKTPRRIAFIQCVGSRDTTCDNDYCSSVCCMASTKQAILIKEHEPGTDVAIFYIDLRAFGKDFDRYCERAKKLGVRYIRSIPSRMFPIPGTDNLRLTYLDGAMKPVEEEFDLVVLCATLEPSRRLLDQAGRLGIQLNRWGFADTDRSLPVNTSVPGIFVAGAFEEPKDIPDSVVQASGAAAEAMTLLAPARGTQLRKKLYPPERDVAIEQPRVGVFVCHCGSNIASVVDVEDVVEAIQALPGVAHAEHTMYACADDSQADLREKIAEHRLNRVVVASCTPRTHEPIFRDTLREAGLNPYLLEMANIRDQCSWVHGDQRDAANNKAVDLVRMAVARASRLAPLVEDTIAVRQGAVVVGGGLAGMTASLALADQGFRVDLIEKSERLGGTLNEIHSQLEGGDVQAFLARLIERVENHKRIGVHRQTVVSNVSGFVGNYTSTLKPGDDSGEGSSQKIEHGALIVATGATELKPSSFLYGRNERVLTQLELGERLANDSLGLTEKPTIVMLQCVEQRNDERPYCSRVCCATAVKNALALRERYPEARIAVFYRDVRTYGFREAYYRLAREKGVLFVRYDPDRPPELSEVDGGLRVKAFEPALQRPLEIDADLFVLAAPAVPRADREELSTLLRVPLNADRFFLEAHMKLRPVDFASEGIFLCGAAHSPKFINETIAQAKAAASRAASILARRRMPVGGQISHVDSDKCISCMTCYAICPYMAPRIGEGNKAEIQPAVCMGCGICAAECPAMAIQLRHFTNTQIEAAIEELLELEPEERETVASKETRAGIAPLRWTRRE